MAVPRHDAWRGTPFHVPEPRQQAPRAAGHVAAGPRRHAWRGTVHLPRHAWWRGQTD
jgi:hypothetical protein